MLCLWSLVTDYHLTKYIHLKKKKWHNGSITNVVATINQNRSCIYRLPGYRGQVEKILFRKAIYEWRVSECQHSYIERILNFKKQKYFKVPSFWNSLACHQFHGEFYRANDIMEKESCKVFRIFPNCRTCFKKRIFSIVPFLVISNGIRSCFRDK